MYEVVSKTGVTVYGPSSIQNCKEYIAQAISKGSKPGFLSITEEVSKMERSEIRETLEKQLQLLSERSITCSSEESLAHVSETMIRLSEKLLEMEKLQIDDGGTTESPLDTMLQAVQQAIDGIGSK